MTRDDTPAGAAGPHGRPDPDSGPAPDIDGADAPSLAAARDAWRALREPLAPGPDLDARIRAAARRAATGPQPSGGSPTPGGDAAVRPPASTRGRIRHYAGWGLALAATLVGVIVLVLPPAPLADLPLEAPPQAGPASEQDARAAAEDAAAIAAPPTEVQTAVAASPSGGPPHRASMPPAPRAESRPAAMADSAAAEARVERPHLPPATSVVPVADAPAAGAQGTPPAAAAPAVAAPPAKAGADVEATFRAPSPASSAPAAQTASPVASRATDATLAGVDDAAAIARELAELRALLRARDPALPVRLRAFVARHPAYPLARTDPALAEVLVRDPARP